MKRIVMFVAAVLGLAVCAAGQKVNGRKFTNEELRRYVSGCTSIFLYRVAFVFACICFWLVAFGFSMRDID